MIKSEDEYQAAHRSLMERKTQIAEEELRLKEKGLDAAQRKRALDPWRSFVLQMEEEMEAYERLQRGDIGELVNLHELGRTLVALRIASKITQRELARRLKVDESQVSRWERNEYHGITIEKAAAVLDALGARTKTICEELGMFA
jgi:DNA-binding XRE family transcriptional regulator